jgi:hypothetical protein
MVDSILRHSRATRPLLPDWKPLFARCDTLRKARNDIVHRRVTQLQIGRSKPRLALVVYKHDIRHNLKEKSEMPSWIGIDRVKELSVQFTELGRDLTQFFTENPRASIKAATFPDQGTLGSSGFAGTYASRHASAPISPVLGCCCLRSAFLTRSTGADDVRPSRLVRSASSSLTIRRLPSPSTPSEPVMRSRVCT